MDAPQRIPPSAVPHGGCNPPRESDAGKFLNIFARSITEWAKERETSSGEDNNDNKDSENGVLAEEEKIMNKHKVNQATAETLATIEDDCDDVLAFLQAVAFKYPRVIAAPLSLRADKCARVWFCHWTEINLTWI